METCNARHVRAPRVAPLASCLAAALAFGSGVFSPAHAKAFTERPAIGQLIERLGPLDQVRKPLPLQPSLVTLLEPADSGRHRPAVPTGSTIPVTNCNDDGPGSLRDAIENLAVSGDTIDLTNTGCSTITLTTGSIFMPQADLTLQGPGRSLIIDGNGAYSLRHTGSGTLAIYDLSVVDGRKYLDASYNIDAKGGCVYSFGTAALVGTYLKYCTAATANSSYASLGGAVYGREAVIAVDSTIILGNANGSGLSAGGAVYTPGMATIAYSQIGLSYSSGPTGGVFAPGGLFMKYSSVVNNSGTVAGGLYAAGNIFITNSTIAGNDAGAAGGALFGGVGATGPITLVDSTVSGNTAGAIGGLGLKYSAEISNSTIAFNSETNASNTKYGAGIYTSNTLDLQSSIVSTNTLNHSVSGLLPDDLGGPGVLTGANNAMGLVLAPLDAPPGTLFEDPKLAPLSFNGGLTATHALKPESPVIDAGNNAAGLFVDQRGPGFPRVIGASADIGAFEFDLDDLIFADNFD
jgi:hypothetical protein